MLSLMEELTATENTSTLDRIETPIGTLLLASDSAQRLILLDWEDLPQRWQRLLDRYHGRPTACRTGPVPAALRAPIEAYFAGDLRAIESLPVAPRASAFQARVWQALRSIGAGETLSYGELAKRLGCASAARAVGLANGQNPISIVVPCHRVIGKSGALTGYAGGLTRKRWLLDHEAANLTPAYPTLGRQRLIHDFAARVAP
jgi:methylated-DNA-[protein]-cysteine S-methyltransferase